MLPFMSMFKGGIKPYRRRPILKFAAAALSASSALLWARFTRDDASRLDACMCVNHDTQVAGYRCGLDRAPLAISVQRRL